MDTNLIDPNNQVPQVTPGDVWEDADGLPPNPETGATVLPPKRALADAHSSSPTGKKPEGLRIDSRPQAKEADGSTRRLEVQEINARVLRLDPEEPEVAKVPRQVAFRELPVQSEEESNRTGESKEWGGSRKHSMTWILGAGTSVAILVVLAVVLLPIINRSNSVRPGQGLISTAPVDDAPESNASNELLPLQFEAEQVFRKFATAMIPDDALPVIRNATALEPLIRANFRPGLVSKSWIPPEDIRWNVFEADKLPYGILEGSLPDFTHFTAYLVYSGKHLTLDWKATTSYSTATFEELAENQGDPAEIRARIAPALFYTATFPEAEFRSFQLVSPNTEKAIWVYTRRGDKADTDLARLFPTGEIIQASSDPQKVTLRLEHGPSGGLPNQWLIAELLYKDWLIP